MRPRGDSINIWNQSGDDKEEIETTTKELNVLLDSNNIKYQLHKEDIEKVSIRSGKLSRKDKSKSVLSFSHSGSISK